MFGSSETKRNQMKRKNESRESQEQDNNNGERKTKKPKANIFAKDYTSHLFGDHHNQTTNTIPTTTNTIPTTTNRVDGFNIDDYLNDEELNQFLPAAAKHSDELFLVVDGGGHHDSIAVSADEGGGNQLDPEEKQQEELRALFESLRPSATFTIISNSKSELVYVSDAMKKKLGYVDEDLKEMTYPNLFHPIDFQRVLNIHLKHMLQRSNYGIVENIIFKKKGYSDNDPGAKVISARAVTRYTFTDDEARGFISDESIFEFK
jgi:PAS domain S-box-containing protein